MGGHLLDLLVNHLGLPEDYARNQLTELLATRSLSEEALSLDQIREIASDLLQEVVLETLKE